MLHVLAHALAAHPLGFAGILCAAFVLGVVHGITPDEHTWPITFSYAIGAYSTRRGLVAGLTFSLAFAAQRALASELAYLSLGRWLQAVGHDGPVYVLVGAAMAAAGAYVLRFDRVVHLHLFGSGRRGHRDIHHRRSRQRPAPGALQTLRAPSPAMALVHGFLAGWGLGAFALFLYTVLAPASPGAAWAWLPGLAFGAGTAAVQAPAGALFGGLAARRGLTPADTERMAHAVAGRTLFWGGLVFAAGGLLLVAFPFLGAAALPTRIAVPNLDRIGPGLVLVSVVVIGIGLGSMFAEVRRHRAAGARAEPADPQQDVAEAE